MHQTKKGNQYYFGAKTHIGVDLESGLVHKVHVTATIVTAVTQVDNLLHGKESMLVADLGYTGVEKRNLYEGRQVVWQIAVRRSTYEKNARRSVLYKAYSLIERAKSKRPFRVIKHQFGCAFVAGEECGADGHTIGAVEFGWLADIC